MAISRTLIIAAALSLSASNAMAQAPANDDCATAGVALAGPTAVDTTSALDSGNVLTGATCGITSEIFADVWFTYTPTATDDYDIELVDSGSGAFDTKLAVYGLTTCPAAVGNLIDCDDDSGAGQFSKVTVSLTMGSTVLIRVGSFDASTTEVPVELRITPTPAPPAPPLNDDCATALAASPGITPFNSVTATDGTGLALNPMICDMGSFGDEQIYQDVWYLFTPAATNDYDIAAVPNGNVAFDTRIAIYNQSACPDNPLNVLDCDDDSGPGVEAAMSNVFLFGGSTYLIRAGSFDSMTNEEPAALLILVSPPPPATPANDDCGTAIAVSAGTTPFDSSGATQGSGLALDSSVCDMGPFGDEQIHNDVWFTYTPGGTGSYDIEVTNNGNTPFDSRIAIYDQVGCPDSPANVIYCDDDAGPSFEASIFSAALTGGQSYLIRVGSFESTTAAQPAALSIAFGAPAPTVPSNDNCVSALPVGLGISPFDSRAATNGPGLTLDPMVCDMGTFGDDQIYADVWFSFTAATSGSYQVGAVSNGNAPFDSRIAVYDQSSCPDVPANVIACDDDSGPSFQATTPVTLAAGSTYLVRAGSYSTTTIEEVAALEITFLGTNEGNDTCANATPISAFGLYPFDTSVATTDGSDLAGFCDPGEFGSDQVSRDLWFAYTPAVGGCTYITTFGLAGFDTRIAVYDSTSCPDDPATVIACNDDEEIPVNAPFEAGLDVTLAAGQTYLLRVGTYSPGTVGGPGMISIGAGPGAIALNNGGAGPPQVGAPGCTVAFPEFCTGDGGNQMGCTNCPCSNNAPAGSGGGCLNSSGFGTRLIPSGDTSVSLPSGDTTDLRFAAEGLPATAFSILNSGDAVAPGNMANPCFGLNSGAQAMQFDGLRCAIMNTRRHGGRSADINGEIGVSNNPWGGEGGPPVGIAQASIGFSAGQTRFFQIINRDDPLLGCMRGLNTSQSVEVTFEP